MDQPSADGTIFEAAVPARITTKQQLFKFFAEKLRFPEYFGFNWDAFDECINDLSWLNKDKVKVLHGHTVDFYRKGELAPYVDIVEDSDLIEAFFPASEKDGNSSPHAAE
jgi:hypothetical protein